MIGAISGDVIGSVHEFGPPIPKDFLLFDPYSRFTDDTVLTVAVASAIRKGEEFGASIRRWGRRYPHAGAHLTLGLDGRWHSQRTTAEARIP